MHKARALFVWEAFRLMGTDSWATIVAACSSSAFESGKAAGADAGGLHAATGDKKFGTATGKDSP